MNNNNKKQRKRSTVQATNYRNTFFYENIVHYSNWSIKLIHTLFMYDLAWKNAESIVEYRER